MKPIKRKYKPTIVCDKCHKSIGKMKPSYKKVGEIEYRYWRCRHCSTVYEIVDTGEKDEDGKAITKREPVPFDMKKCTLVLWALI